MKSRVSYESVSVRECSIEPSADLEVVNISYHDFVENYCRKHDDCTEAGMFMKGTHQF